MAFFKFRLPGNSSAAAAEAHAAAPGESVEVIRRRARHRLMGAVVLVFVAVVAFPLLFDSQPRPVAVDTPILIPERQSTPALAVGTPVPVAQSPAKPLLPAASVSAHASLDPAKEEVVAPSAPAPVKTSEKTSEPAAPVASAPAEKPVSTASSAKGQAAVAGKSEPKDKAASKPADDGHKAKALLEGKTGSTDHATKFMIQVGAFSDADKAREVRRKLEQAGLKVQTQSVEGKDGKRTTRVRVGPFESRADADKAAARVRKLDLPANLIAQ